MEAQAEAEKRPAAAAGRVAETAAATAPFLSMISEGAWMRFVGEMEAYRARGGRTPLRTLIATEVADLLQELDVQLDDGEEQEAVAKITELFAPHSLVEAHDKFSQIQMATTEFNLEAVLDYSRRYARLARLCTADVLPKDHRLCALYIAGLRPKRLSLAVALREPMTLSEARKCAVEEVRKLIGVLRFVGQSVTADYGAAARPPVGSRPERVAGSATTTRKLEIRRQEQRDVRCYACGTLGHRVYECPKRDNPARPLMTRGREVTVPTAPASNLRTGRSTEPRVTRKATGSLPGPPGRFLMAAAVDDSKDAAGSLHQADLPVHAVELFPADDTDPVKVNALLDTGSTMCLVSPSVATALIRGGAASKTRPTEIRTAGGMVVVSEFVTCQLSTKVQGRSVRVELEAGVRDVGEELVLGFPFLQSAGLLFLLEQAAVGACNGNRSVRPECPTARASAVVSGQRDRDGEGSDGEDDSDGDALVTPTVSPDASQELASAIRATLEEYSDLFGDLPPEGALVEPMPIDLIPGESPRTYNPRRLSPAMQQVVAGEVEELLKAGVIVPSSSRFASPTVLVKKKDGGRRLCVDYRGLNSCTIDMKFPLPHTKTILERMAGRRVFATLDLRQGFHQIPLERNARHLTAFSTPEGLYEYTRVPFGLKNSPSYFQQTMSRVLGGLSGCCQVFIDDIVVFGDDQPSFIQNLVRVFDRLRWHRFRLKASKCKFGLSKVEYLGHMVSGDGIELSESKRDAIRNVREPSDVGQLRAFLGLANYFREFIPSYATMARPLTRLCSPKTRFGWSDVERAAFNEIKGAIISAPMLAHLDYGHEVVLRCDASLAGVGGVLLQRTGLEERPVAFVSKAFSPTEARWTTLEQECYAIYYCITALSHHLLGHKFTVETDHKNLVYLDKATSPKVVRWRLRLQEYDFQVRHIPGRENAVADALSRCLVLGPNDGTRPDGAAEHIAGGEPVEANPEEERREEPCAVEVVPDDDAERDGEAADHVHWPVISRFHGTVVGHRGVHATLDMMRSAGVVFDGMSGAVARFIASCPTCQKVRLGQGSVVGAVKTTAVEEPFTVVAVDVIGPLPEDSRTLSKYVLVAIDGFSRFVELFPCRDTSAAEAARALLQLFGRYGAPRAVRSDQGPQFTAAVLRELLQLMGVGQQFTVAYRPQSNGIVERVNGEVLRHLRAIVMDRRLADCWVDALPLVQRCINSTVHATTGVAPARMLFGDAIDLNRRLLRDDPAVDENQDEGGRITHEDYVQRLNNVQRAVVRASNEHQRRVIEERLRAGPPEEAVTVYAAGDLVLATHASKPPNKLAPRWRGPFAVVERVGSMYTCQDLRTLKHIRFHETRLKKYDAERTEFAVAVAAVDNEEFEVEAIVDHRLLPGRGPRRRRLEFRVHWRGYEAEEDTWLPFAEVRDLAALDVYALEHPELRL